jgi:hypothetical protein
LCLVYRTYSLKEYLAVDGKSGTASMLSAKVGHLSNL